MIFVQADYKEYIKSRNVFFENQKFWFPGPCCVTIDKFLEEIQKLLCKKTYYKKERENFIDLMCSNKGNNNCERIYNYFFENGILSSRVMPEKKFIDGYNELCSENQKLKDMLKNNKINEEKIKSLENELESIYYSRSWNLIQSLKKIIKK